MQPVRPAAPGRALAGIAVAVLAAHIVLLQSVSSQMQPPHTSAVKALITRTLLTSPAEPPVAVPSPPVAEAAPLQPARSARSVTPTGPKPLTAPVPERLASAPMAPEPVASAAPIAPASAARLEEPNTASAAAAPSTPASAPSQLHTAASTSASASSSSPSPAVPLAIPGSIKLNYKVFAVYRGQDRQASGQLHWRHDGANYDALLEMSVPLLGTRSDRSTGRITSEGLAPQRYASKSRTEEATHFDRERGRIVFSANKPEATLMAGAQDRLSVILQLSSLAGGSPAKFRTGSSVTIQTAGPREAEPWVFTVDGDEQLVLPGGAMTALKLTRLPRKEFDQKVELWLAPGMDYVPVRVRLTHPNGDSFDQQWSGTDKG